jgi:hypothetical protein
VYESRSEENHSGSAVLPVLRVGAIEGVYPRDPDGGALWDKAGSGFETEGQKSGEIRREYIGSEEGDEAMDQDLDSDEETVRGEESILNRR